MLPGLQDVDTPFRHWSFLSFNPRVLSIDRWSLALGADMIAGMWVLSFMCGSIMWVEYNKDRLLGGPKL
jgi:hypothetical protein